MFQCIAVDFLLLRSGGAINRSVCNCDTAVGVKGAVHSYTKARDNLPGFIHLFIHSNSSVEKYF